MAPAAMKGAVRCRWMWTDKGEGIDPLHLPRLTERFYRVDTTAAGPWGAPGLDWPSSSISSTDIADGCGSRRSLGKAAHFR